MHRVLHEIKALAQEMRLHLFAMRKVFQRGSVPDKIRARFKSRLFLIKSRVGEVMLTLREVQDLTGPQQAFTRREMGTIRGGIRECERFLSSPSISPRPGAPAVTDDIGWLDLPAGVPAEDLPPWPAPPELESPPESLDFLDALVIPVDEGELPELTGPVLAGIAHCPVCGDPDPAERVTCPVCGVSYHRECWQYFEGCAIYGCAGSGALK